MSDAPEDVQQNEATGYNPVWEDALAFFPDGSPQREKVLETIRESERNSNKAIDAARRDAVPEEWRDLIANAAEAEIDPGALADSYNQVQSMQEAIQADPDAWLEQMRDAIDEAVSSGQISRAEGAALRRDAATTVASVDTVDAETDSQREIRELRERLDRQEQTAQQQRQEAQEAYEEQEAQAAAERDAEAFGNTLEQRFAADPAIAAATDRTKGLVANQAINLMYADDKLSHEDAIAQSIAMFKEEFNLGSAAPTRRVPVGGSNAQVPSATPNIPNLDERTRAMIEEGMRQNSAM